MLTTTDNYLEGKKFLDILFSGYFKNNDGFVELRFVDGKAISEFYPRGDITENKWTEIVGLNQNCHVFVGVNPRPVTKKKTQNEIKDIICLWVDVDGKDFEGGKEEALRRLKDFSIEPSITIDSGHGYHGYWVFSKPLICITDEQRQQIKRVLSGMIRELGADHSKLHLDACLRFPGTVNAKNSEIPVPCRIVNLSNLTYKFEDFLNFEDTSYYEQQVSDAPLPLFGTRKEIISLSDEKTARTDVEKLDVSFKTKNLILTGELLKSKNADKTRSARDFSIICELIYQGYDYDTIQSIFFNRFLGCSNRIMAKGEKALQWDVRSALTKAHKRRNEESPQSLEIEKIKELNMKADRKLKAIKAFIVKDMLEGPKSAGEGFKNLNIDKFFFFDNSEKRLMNLESEDFYCYFLNRYRITTKEFKEFKDAIMTAIWKSKKVVIPRRSFYWDRENFALYISDNANGIYRLEGSNIEYFHNGIDGVFFEHDSSLSHFKYDPKQDVINYFEKLGPSIVYGLDLKQFDNPDCLLKKYLIDRASFSQDKGSPLTSEHYSLLLIIYFYSLFFESLMREKPIACFVGIKESGKSFLATSIGKILFGDGFENIGLPKSSHDLAVVMDKRPYLVIDNLDSYVGSDILNLLCATATGMAEANRKLYTDKVMISFTPKCFLAITSRESKFKRDDFVSRLLLFSMEKINNPVSRSELTDSLINIRSALMTEVLTNLNSIIKILLLDQGDKNDAGDNWRPHRCLSRLGDWETFGTKICSPALVEIFQSAVQQMNKKKDEYVLEDDPIYEILRNKIYERKENIEDMSAQSLYSELLKTAELMKNDKEFSKRYKNARSMARHIANIKNELEREFHIEIIEGSSRKKTYTFKSIQLL
jgi:hypothetical protein